MKKFLSMLLLLMTALTMTAAAEEAKNPLRLARLPIIILSETPDENAMAGLELKISRAVHLPLNGTLQAIEYISATKAAEEMQDVWRKIYKKNRKAQLQEAMEPLAKKLKADMVVCPVLRRFSEDISINASLTEGAENHLMSRVEVEMIIYERETEEITSKKASRSYSGEESSWGTARFLADDCMSEVIESTELREKVLRHTPIGEKRTPVERKVIER